MSETRGGDTSFQQMANFPQTLWQHELEPSNIAEAYQPLEMTVPCLGILIGGHTFEQHSIPEDVRDTLRHLSVYEEAIRGIEEMIKNEQSSASTEKRSIREEFLSLSRLVTRWKEFAGKIDEDTTTETLQVRPGSTHDKTVDSITARGAWTKVYTWTNTYMPRFKKFFNSYYQMPDAREHYAYFLNDDNNDVKLAARAVDTAAAVYSNDQSPTNAAEYKSKYADFMATLRKQKNVAAIELSRLDAASVLARGVYVEEEIDSDVWYPYRAIERSEVETVIMNYVAYWDRLNRTYAKDYQTSFMDVRLIDTLGSVGKRRWQPLHGMVRVTDDEVSELLRWHEFDLVAALRGVRSGVPCEEYHLFTLLLLVLSTSNYFVPFYGRSLVYVLPFGFLEDDETFGRVAKVESNLRTRITAHDSIVTAGRIPDETGRLSMPYILVIRTHDPIRPKVKLFVDTTAEIAVPRQWMDRAATLIAKLLMQYDDQSTNATEDEVEDIMYSPGSPSTADYMLIEAVRNAVRTISDEPHRSVGMFGTAFSAYLYAEEIDNNHAITLSQIDFGIIRSKDSGDCMTPFLELLAHGWPVPKVTLAGRLLTRMPPPEQVPQRPIDAGSIFNYIASLDEDTPPFFRFGNRALMETVTKTIAARAEHAVTVATGLAPLSQNATRNVAGGVMWAPAPLMRRLPGGEKLRKDRIAWFPPEFYMTNETIFCPKLIREADTEIKSIELLSNQGNFEDILRPEFSTNLATQMIASAGSIGDHWDIVNANIHTLYESCDTVRPVSVYGTLMQDPMEHVFSAFAGLFTGTATCLWGSLPANDGRISPVCLVHDMRSYLSLFSCEGMFPFAAYLPPCPSRTYGDTMRFLSGDLMALLPTAGAHMARLIAESFEDYFVVALQVLTSENFDKLHIWDVHGRKGDSDHENYMLTPSEGRVFKCVCDYVHAPVVGPQMEPLLTVFDTTWCEQHLETEERLVRYEARKTKKRSGVPENTKISPDEFVRAAKATRDAIMKLPDLNLAYATVTQMITLIVCADALKQYFTVVEEKKLNEMSSQSTNFTIQIEHRPDKKMTVKYNVVDVISQMYPDVGKDSVNSGNVYVLDPQFLGKQVHKYPHMKKYVGGTGTDPSTTNQSTLDVGWVQHYLWTTIQSDILRKLTVHNKTTTPKNIAKDVYKYLCGMLLVKLPEEDDNVVSEQKGMGAVILTLMREAMGRDISKKSAPHQLRELLEGKQNLDEDLVDGLATSEGMSVNMLKWRDLRTYLKQFKSEKGQSYKNAECQSRGHFAACAKFIRACLYGICKYMGEVGTPMGWLLGHALQGRCLSTLELESCFARFGVAIEVSEKLNRAHTTVASLRTMNASLAASAVIDWNDAMPLCARAPYSVFPTTQRTDDPANPVKRPRAPRRTGKPKPPSKRRKTSFKGTEILAVKLPEGDYELDYYEIDLGTWDAKCSIVLNRLLGAAVQAFATVSTDLDGEAAVVCQCACKRYGIVSASDTCTTLTNLWKYLENRWEGRPERKRLDDVIAAGISATLRKCAAFFPHAEVAQEDQLMGLYVTREDETLSGYRDEMRRWLNEMAWQITLKRDSKQFLPCEAMNLVANHIKDIKQRWTASVFNTRIENVPLSVNIKRTMTDAHGNLSTLGKCVYCHFEKVDGEYIMQTIISDDPSVVKDQIGYFMVDEKNETFAVSGTCCARRLRMPRTLEEAVDCARYDRSQDGVSMAVILRMREVMTTLDCSCKGLSRCTARSPEACLLGELESGIGDIATAEMLDDRMRTMFGTDYVYTVHGILARVHTADITVECAITLLNLMMKHWPRSAEKPLLLPDFPCQALGCGAGPVNRSFTECPARRCISKNDALLLSKSRAEHPYYIPVKTEKGPKDVYIIDLCTKDVVSPVTDALLDPTYTNKLLTEKWSLPHVPCCDTIVVLNNHGFARDNFVDNQTKRILMTSAYFNKDENQVVAGRITGPLVFPPLRVNDKQMKDTMLFDVYETSDSGINWRGPSDAYKEYVKQHLHSANLTAHTEHHYVPDDIVTATQIIQEWIENGFYDIDDEIHSKVEDEVSRTWMLSMVSALALAEISTKRAESLIDEVQTYKCNASWSNNYKLPRAAASPFVPRHSSSSFYRNKTEIDKVKNRTFGKLAIGATLRGKTVDTMVKLGTASNLLMASALAWVNGVNVNPNTGEDAARRFFSEYLPSTEPKKSRMEIAEERQKRDLYHDKNDCLIAAECLFCSFVDDYEAKENVFPRMVYEKIAANVPGWRSREIMDLVVVLHKMGSGGLFYPPDPPGKPFAVIGATESSAIFVTQIAKLIRTKEILPPVSSDIDFTQLKSVPASPTSKGVRSNMRKSTSPRVASQLDASLGLDDTQTPAASPETSLIAVDSENESY